MDLLLKPTEPSDWSRAEGEYGDYYEEQDNQDLISTPSITFYPPIFTFSSQVKEKLNANQLECELMIIGMEGAGSCFIDAAFPNKTAVASLLLPEQILKEASLDTRINDAVTYFYSIEAKKKENQSSKTSIIVATCKSTTNELRCAQWSSILLEKFNPNRIIVLDSIRESEYKTLYAPQLPMLRCLQTRKDQQMFGKCTNFCTYLEPPNIVSGLSAAILSKCEMYKKNALLFVSLEENRMLGWETVSAYEPSIKQILEQSCLTLEKQLIDMKINYQLSVKHCKNAIPESVYM